MARKDKDHKKPEPPPPSPEPTNNSDSGSDAEESDSDVVSSSSSDAAPPTTTTIPTTVKRTLTPHHHHSQPDPETESESESDDDTPPPPPPPKPTTITKQPRSKPPTPKRPAQSDNSSKGSEKRPKKDSSSTGPSAATPGKVLFQRLWSDEDEIVILKGMIEYKEKKGVDPMTHVDDFLDFIKKSLHVPDANKAQIMSKVRRLKKRFINAQKKKLTDPHEITAFELSKKIWRGVEEVDEVNHRENGVTVAVAAAVKEEERKNVGGSGNGEVELGFLGADGEMVKAAMSIMGDGERKEMRRLIKKANAAHWDAYLLRLKVLDVAAKKYVEGIRNNQC